MIDMYDNLAQALRKTRIPLYKACLEVGIDSETVELDKLPLLCCDWCGFWDKPVNMTIENEDDVYCFVCENEALLK